MQNFGETVVNRITPEMDRGYVAERKKASVANKTVNLELWGYSPPRTITVVGIRNCELVDSRKNVASPAEPTNSSENRFQTG